MLLRPKERSLVAALALREPTPVSADELVTALWSDGPPASARQSLHNHLTRLRRTAPDLVVVDRRGYSLDPGVHVVGQGWDDVPRDSIELADLAPAPGHARLIDRFRRRPVDDRGDLLTHAGHASLDAVVARLEQTVEADPHDERSWWQLMVAHATRGDVDEVTSALARARRALADVGLEPGRRLLDIERLARDGVTDVDVLTSDPYGTIRLPVDTPVDLTPDQLAEVRTLLTVDGPTVLEVVGPADRARSDVLDLIVNEARRRSVDVAMIRASPRQLMTPMPRVDWHANRPALIVIDDAERASDLAAMLARLTARRRSHPSGSTSFVVTATTPGTNGARTPSITVDAHDSPTTTPTLDDLPDESLELVALLAVLDDDVTAAEIGTIVDDVDHALLPLLRAGIVRADAPELRIRISSGADRDQIDRRIDARQRARLAGRLLDLEFAGESPLRAGARRTRLLLDTGSASPAQISQTALATAELARLDGDLDGGAEITRAAALAIEADVGRSAEWGQLSLLTGVLDLARGADGGDEILLDVVEAAHAAGDHDLLSRATFELCGLGEAATAGTADQRRSELVTAVLADERDPRNRARLGAAAAMVYSFAAQPERLREIYEQAERDARACGDDELLIDVLPMAYMSLPLPSDNERRLATAAELERLGDRFDSAEAHWEALHLRIASEITGATGDPRSSFRHLVDVHDRLHERSRAWEMCYVRSNIALLDGDLDAARQHIDESLGFAGVINDDRIAAVYGAHHLAISLAEGSVAAFVDLIADIVADQPDVGAWRSALAMAAAHADDLDRAREAIDSLLALGDRAWAPDHTLTPSMICFGEAALALGDDEIMRLARDQLDSVADSWSWCGSCTFGPIGLTLARLHLRLGDVGLARHRAARTIESAATLRAPRYASAAAEVLLAATDTAD